MKKMTDGAVDEGAERPETTRRSRGRRDARIVDALVVAPYGRGRAREPAGHAARRKQGGKNIGARTLLLLGGGANDEHAARPGGAGDGRARAGDAGRDARLRGEERGGGGDGGHCRLARRAMRPGKALPP